MRLLPFALCLLPFAFSPVARAQTPAKPNILLILADDLGFGDLSALYPQGKIKTPNLDRLASQGIAFTDAHSASAVCTPTRYGILTGRYPWRSRLKSGVLSGYSPHRLEPTRLTLPAMLKQQGYHTAALGKWHLGMDWATRTPGANPNANIVDHSKPLANSPTAVGFDTFYGIAASLDMPPFAWIENDHLTAQPTAKKKWIREGPADPNFEAADVLPTLTRKSIEYLQSRATVDDDRPFFLYLALASPHTPIVPTKEWQGRSGINPYADFVMQTDDAVGQVLAALDKSGLAANTLVLFASDNGCSPAADLKTLHAAGHDPSASKRGAKADIFDGGHRIPLLARWPNHIKPSATCPDPVCLNDLFATFAAITDFKLPPNAAEDSVNILPDLLGTATQPTRDAIIHASIDGSLAIRQGNWKLELCPGSGGWSFPRYPKDYKDLPQTQLYDLEKDPAETNNLASANPEVVERLTALLQSYIDNGRSTPGPAQHNDTLTPIRPKKSANADKE
jgi:arylsulfatase A-like enzyme